MVHLRNWLFQFLPFHLVYISLRYCLEVHDSIDTNFHDPTVPENSLHLSTSIAPINTWKNKKTNSAFGWNSYQQNGERTALTPAARTNLGKKRRKLPIKLLHVLSPYSVRENPNDNYFYPLDQAQNVSLGSIYKAWLRADDDIVNVRVICSVFPEDIDNVPNDFDYFVLNRSTATEYPNLNPPTQLPFIDEIIQGAAALTNGMYDVLMYTNADIGLTKYFYNAVAKSMRKKDALIINRRTIPRTFNNQTVSSLDLHVDFYSSISNGEIHPGFDCFVLRKYLVETLTLGDLFIGHPPWARTFKEILKRSARRFEILPSNFSLTFHLGDDRGWLKGESVKHRTLTKDEKYWVGLCQTSGKNMDIWTDYWLQNAINCGKLWEKRNYRSALIEGFVRKGAEENYMALHGTERVGRKGGTS